jgi:hypothetical protein
MRIFVGLKRKLEFNLISPSGELLTPKPIQLLVIDAFPTSVDQSWGKLITDGFDADVIKCWADIDSDGQLTPISFSAGALLIVFTMVNLSIQCVLAIHFHK